MKHICFAFAVVAMSGACLANNNLFLPGDAYFPTELTRAAIQKLQAAKTGERTFKYSSLGGYDGAFCGYAGYRHAVVPAVDDRFAENLARAYAEIREFEERELVERDEDGKTRLIETNGIHVLLYSADFDIHKHRLGLRYNENWVAETVKFGHRREHIRMCSLVDDPRAVEISWRDAEIVDGLKGTLPDAKPAAGQAVNKPVVIRGPVNAIVIRSRSLKHVFLRHDAIVTVVDSEGITKMVYHNGKWQPESSVDSTF